MPAGRGAGKRRSVIWGAAAPAPGQLYTHGEAHLEQVGQRRSQGHDSAAFITTCAAKWASISTRRLPPAGSYRGD
eukprot:CAMPEP_0195084252 /NCGR_PEP_ID=MMETSP0448-20130528/24970_1 /TAXON_ID=66468 /ORGANISM="Heterocapsa triquestra, Strain CCMP 448" /LENGTH=74 /DNA_ID=CAMNT_0040117537 /DNA_START=179 /DNA_END=403 /DNA_ORIENTATION=-